jgi:5-phospho-D-xylono-1,4-lactonase
MAIIRTVLGDIDPAELGPCYAHEHVIGHPPGSTPEQDFMFTSHEAAVRELGWFQEAGGRALVEMSTPDYGRDPAGLRGIAEETGVYLICATGYHKEKFSAAFIADRSEESLIEQFTAEVNDGIEETGVRAGVIKAASSLHEISVNEAKLFRAAARAHQQTGAPILTHTEAGTMALEQVELLTGRGVSPDRIAIGHVDRKLDWDMHLALAQTGVYLGYDQVAKEQYQPDRRRIEFIRRLVGEGHGRQILLAGDMARRSYWPSYGTGGGPGLTYILWRFLPWLRASGLAEPAVRDLIIHNPARLLAFEPVSAAS